MSTEAGVKNELVSIAGGGHKFLLRPDLALLQEIDYSPVEAEGEAECPSRRRSICLRERSIS